jgi:hypothetical protein
LNAGLWIWPSDVKAQQEVLRKVAASPHLLQALTYLMSSKEGLSNSELDDLTADNSNWMTLWTVKQLTSLGFIEYKVDFFGGPAWYQLTELGRNALGMITGQLVQQKPPAQAPPAAHVAAPGAES